MKIQDFPARSQAAFFWQRRVVVLILMACAGPWAAHAEVPQNPSPMVEHTRAHTRLVESRPEGRRHELTPGRLFVPAKVTPQGGTVPLLVFFHGGSWIPEVAAEKAGMAVLHEQWQARSGWTYGSLFKKSERFGQWVREAEAAAALQFGPVYLGGWSAGCQAVREILRHPENVAWVEGVYFIDGVHSSYAEGKPGPLESRLDTGNLEPILHFAKLAVEGRKQCLLVHGEIFPGTFASTTETADWLLRELQVKRKPVLAWGPMGTQQLSEVKAGRFVVMGFAGNSAPDHVDLLHALPAWLEIIQGDP